MTLTSSPSHLQVKHLKTKQMSDEEFIITPYFLLWSSVSLLPFLHSVILSPPSFCCGLSPLYSAFPGFLAATLCAYFHASCGSRASISLFSFSLLVSLPQLPLFLLLHFSADTSSSWVQKLQEVLLLLFLFLSFFNPITVHTSHVSAPLAVRCKHWNTSLQTSSLIWINVS